jgi:hypothetical protein
LQFADGKISFLTWQLSSGNILTVSATNECDELSGCEPETLLSTQTSTLTFSGYASNNVEIMPEITKGISVIEPRVETDKSHNG